MSNSLVPQIGKRIKELRLSSAKMSQETLAKAAGVNRAYISRVECGRQNLTINNLEAICKALNVSAKDFFAGIKE